MTDGKMLFGYDRRRTSTLTVDSQPGAHTGATRKYIPGYSSSNIVYLDTAAGNDAWTGANPTNSPAGTGPFLTYAAAATAASTTKKIRLVNSATLTSNITKPTEATIGTTSTIASTSLTAPVDTWTQAATPSFSTSLVTCGIWVEYLSKFVVGGADGKIAYSSDGDTWTQALTPSFGSDTVFCIAWSPSLRLLISGGGSGKMAYSSDANTWIQVTETLTSNTNINGVSWSESAGVFVAVTNNEQVYSVDGINWNVGQTVGVIGESVTWSDELGLFVIVGGLGKIYYSANGITWTESATPSFSTTTIYSVSWSTQISQFVACGGSGKIAFSADGNTWTQAATPSFATTDIRGVTWLPEIGYFVATGESGKIAYSSDGDTWTQAATPSFSTSNVRGCAYSPLIGKAITFGSSGKIAYSTAYATTISASVAGFSIQAVQYSGTVTAYNCTLKQPGTTAALSLDSCRVTESGSHISNNAVTSLATLYEGDRHTTCTPASQNAIDMNLDTVGGTWYIYNASATAYERIMDCLVEGGIVANYNVTVSGRANVRGTSSNVLFGATVTHRDPKFIDTTDYKLQFQSNGYARNSLAARRSALYFNSAGDARDIGAWSYVESAVSHYFAKNVYLQKGEITHSVEEVVSEQQGDSGAVSVYGNVNRIKEVVTIKYNTEAEADFAVIRAMRLLTDKTVLIQLDPEWSANAGTVVANGNHSAGADVLNIDSTATYNGMTVTISGKTYYPLRAEPSLTATTRLILDRPLEDAVADNDVITRNYPSGAGEYQYAAQSRLDLNRVDPTVMRGYRSGFIIRLVRAYQ